MLCCFQKHVLIAKIQITGNVESFPHYSNVLTCSWLLGNNVSRMIVKYEVLWVLPKISNKAEYIFQHIMGFHFHHIIWSVCKTRSRPSECSCSVNSFLQTAASVKTKEKHKMCVHAFLRNTLQCNSNIWFEKKIQRYKWQTCLWIWSNCSLIVILNNNKQLTNICVLHTLKYNSYFFWWQKSTLCNRELLLFHTFQMCYIHISIYLKNAHNLDTSMCTEGNVTNTEKKF